LWDSIKDLINGALTWDTSNNATFANDVTVTGAVIVDGHSITYPSYTSTELDAVGNAVNTSASKVAGSTVFNSTTGHLVTAVGAADGDVWKDGAGNTINSPV
jgi:hypothetical protein